MAQIRIGVDPDNVFGRQLTALEQSQLPYAASQAANKVAYEIRERWKRQAPRVFDRPTPLTVNAAMYRKATKALPYAEIYLRDEAFKGTPPAKYLLAEVDGGQRRRKGFERLLQSRGLLSPTQFAVMGRGAQGEPVRQRSGRPGDQDPVAAARPAGPVPERDQCQPEAATGQRQQP